MLHIICTIDLNLVMDGLCNLLDVNSVAPAGAHVQVVIKALSSPSVRGYHLFVPMKTLTAGFLLQCAVFIHSEVVLSFISLLDSIEGLVR